MRAVSLAALALSASLLAGRAQALVDCLRGLRARVYIAAPAWG